MKTIIVSNDNLFHLAALHLGDASQWDRIALLNKIDDPFFCGVITLKIPPPDANAGGLIAGQ